MYQSINSYDFERAFLAKGRENQFSYEAKKAIFEYLEQYEEDIGEQIELDVIAICCEYCEYESIDDAIEEMGEDAPDNVEIELDGGGVIIRSF